MSSLCGECKKEYDKARQDRLRGSRPKANRAKGSGQDPDQRRESKKIAQRTYRALHKEEVNLRARTRNKERRNIDVGFAIQTQLRNRLGDAVRKGTKAGSGIRDLGCSVDDLKKHLETKFKPGMTWENYGHGFGCWNIDHIVPLKAFDLTKRQHVLLACNYLNLQPLWHEENMSKGAKIGGDF
jgi:hypothetical protein